MTLASSAIGQTTAFKSFLVALAASVFIAIAAQISVPMFPVPMTLQTLAILLVGLSLGARLGVASVALYLAEGAAGLPVFANGANGLAFAGPTSGFLFGFLMLVAVAGYASDRGWTRSFLGAAVAALVASALLYIPGLAWPLALANVAGIEAGWVGLPLDKVLAGFAVPFLIGDAVKAILAALVVTGAWAALKGRNAA